MKLVYLILSLFSFISVSCSNNSTLSSIELAPIKMLSLELNCPDKLPPCHCGPKFNCNLFARDDTQCDRWECTPKPPNVVAIILGSVFGILGFCLLGVGILLWSKRKQIKEAGGLLKYFQEKRPNLPTHYSYKTVNGSLSGFSSFSARSNQSTVSRMPSILLEAKPEKINFNNGLQAKVVDLDSNSRTQSLIAIVAPNTVASESILGSPIVTDFSEVRSDSEIQPSRTEFFSFQDNPPQTSSSKPNNHLNN